MAHLPPIQLMIMSGADDGTLIDLPAPRDGQFYTIGRREDCDVVLPFDSQISRVHAKITHIDEEWFLEDAESKNGTYFRHEKITRSVPVLPGQLWRVGRTWLRIQSAGSSSQLSDVIDMVDSNNRVNDSNQVQSDKNADNIGNVLRNTGQLSEFSNVDAGNQGGAVHADDDDHA